MFYTPNELLESFKCVFNSIDVAVKGTHLTEIWGQYKALLEKIRGEIEVCIRDQSGEEQQKLVSFGSMCEIEHNNKTLSCFADALMVKSKKVFQFSTNFSSTCKRFGNQTQFSDSEYL